MFRILDVASGTYFHNIQLIGWKPNSFHWLINGPMESIRHHE
jgi:hypothetical protein